jgi:membrane-bound lytic murein transglycosylase F
MGSSLSKLFARMFLVLCCALLLAACSRLDPPAKSHQLLIGILAGPTSYQKDGDAISGFEYDLLEGFAASQKWKTHYIVARDQADLRKLLIAGKIHIAASTTIETDPKLLFSLPIREAKQVLVGNSDDGPTDGDDSDLNGQTIETLFGSPQAEALKKLAGSPPRFTVAELVDLSEHDLLQRVADLKSHLAASDNLNYLLALSYFPDLTVVQELPGQIRTGWAFLPAMEPIWQAVNLFIVASRKDGSLVRLNDRYFGHVQRIKSGSVSKFIDDIRTLLPHYRKQFQAAQVSSGIDWRLIAAVAYQESKWDPLATSFTNVRGMMMLTEDTADRMGVNDRLDPAQSINAGARYIAAMRDELPDEIEEPDRTWFALAAYNLGMGHLNGARTFAKQMKRDSTSWYDMKKVLPLMSQPEYYSRLKAGPARGGEAVIMVENIRNNFDIISRLEPAWQPTPKLSFSLR